MEKLIFATNNKHKLKEVRAMLEDKYELYTPSDFGITEEIPEDRQTLEENASQKSHYIYRKTGQNCFADDTGLEVAALDGAPGVHSARYAGKNKDSEANIDLLLKKLENEEENRDACFRTVVSLIMDEKEYMFEGVVYGTIIRERRGTDGFGYDPVFVPDGYDCTFAEMDPAEKNKISHRADAIRQLVEFLNNR